MPDGRVVFRLAAPKAEKVTFTDGDATNLFSPNGPGPLEGTTKPAVPPGATLPQGGPEFKKTLPESGKLLWAPCLPAPTATCSMVDGMRVLDPVNPRISESRSEASESVTVSGSDLIDTINVPHGAVAEVFYYSEVLKTTRRMHVYTPPGSRNRRPKVSGFLPAPRLQRFRRFVAFGGPSHLHPG